MTHYSTSPIKCPRNNNSSQLAKMIAKLLLIALAVGYCTSRSCLDCICELESRCKPIGCVMDEGSLSCGYFQIKLVYYIDCHTPGKRHGESVVTAWKRCANNYGCARRCTETYINRYKGGCANTGQGQCQIMARIHNRGPNGCRQQNSLWYWRKIQSCCHCS